MSAEAKRTTGEEPAWEVVARDGWDEFLRSFSRQHHGSLVTLEIDDLKTRENVVSHQTPLRSIQLDLEDNKNPRINVTVELDNKTVKHILFRPSELVQLRSERGAVEALRIHSVNTLTTVRLLSER